MHKLKSKYILTSPKARLHGSAKPLIGLTGGIASGKSTAAKILLNLGFGVIDADELVKQIYSMPESIKFISKLSPKCVTNNIIDFTSLRESFFSNKSIQVQIETFLYAKLPSYFINQVNHLKQETLVYDVPLLFENSMQSKLDVNLLISCPQELQIERVISRDKISRKVAQNIISKQMPLSEKELHAQFIIQNTNSIEQLEIEIKIFLESILR